MQSGHMGQGVTIRHPYAGVYAPIPLGSGDLSARYVARTVTEELVNTNRKLLLHSD